MEQNFRIGMLLCLASAAVIFSPAAVLGQENDVPKYRSRSEQVAEHRKIEQAFPELARALRTLHLPPDKMSEVRSKLKRSEADSRTARQELQLLEEENKRQGYNRQAESPRVEELRASLQQSTNQLHSEIKTLLTAQQRDQFDRQLERQNRLNSSNQKKSR